MHLILPFYNLQSTIEDAKRSPQYVNEIAILIFQDHLSNTYIYDFCTRDETGYYNQFILTSNKTLLVYKLANQHVNPFVN